MTIPAPQSSQQRHKDPYKTLGVGHDATPSQIKVAYHKLALQYHPDRLGVQFRQQRQQSQDQNQNQKQQTQSNNDEKEAEAQFHKQATDRFSEITEAYGTLSDPIKKKQYDHLYKYGAFDDEENNINNNNNNNNNNNYSAGMGYSGGYASDFSGGYYRKSPPANNFIYRRCESQDSFFDDVLKTPKNNNVPNNGGTTATTSQAQNVAFNFANASSSHRQPPQQSQSPNQTQSQQQQRQTQTQTPPLNSTKSKNYKGIGFSLTPLNKHLSIHIPSRNEIVMAMSRGERLHNFGARVTVTSMESQRIRSNDDGDVTSGTRGNGGRNKERTIFNCGGGSSASFDEEVGADERGDDVDNGDLVENNRNEEQTSPIPSHYDDGIRVTDGSGNPTTPPNHNSNNTNNNNHSKTSCKQQQLPSKPPTKQQHHLQSKQSKPSKPPTKKIVSTTTRIANGTHRVVKRTAYLHADGRREVVVEENGVERRRYFVENNVPTDHCDGHVGAGVAGKENATNNNNPSVHGNSNNHGDVGNGNNNNDKNSNNNQENGRQRSWYLNIFETCFAPCGGPAMVT